MVNSEDLKQKYGDAIEIVSEKKKEEKGCSRTVELFFSFDIVNSSLYKDENYFGWQAVLSSLLTDIQKEVTKKIPEAQLWRVLGDELIFFVTIKDKEEIYTSINSIYSVLIEENIKVISGFFGQYKKKVERDVMPNDEEEVCVVSNSILAVQAAAWIAIVFNGDLTRSSAYDNFFIKYNVNESQQINEFLGQDIDTGFRIKKETQERRLAVSVELAKILSERTEYLSNLNIITYKTLKGVWRNRLYPIIWYYDPKLSGGVSFKDSFYYDETSYSQLSKEYFLNREKDEGDVASYMFSDVHRALEKVIKDRHLEEKMGCINRIINETESDVKAVENEFNNRLLEFHCATVCCDVENKKVLIAKRKDRKFLSGLWEFGCAKANTEADLSDSIKKEYKYDFGIDIEVVCDQDRDDKEPKPLALYQVNKVEKLQKGVILIAKIVGKKEDIEKTIAARGKHECYRWISKDEIDGFQELAISDFKDTLKKVFSIWDEVFKDE